MFILTAVVAVACGGLFAPWDWLQLLALFYLGIAVPMAMVVALIYTRGYARTFWIGAVFPAGTFLVAAVEEGDPFRILGPLMADVAALNDSDMQRFVLGVHVLVAGIMILLAGLTAMGVRWMVESPRQMRKPRVPIGQPPLLPEFIVPTASEESQSDAG